YSVVMQEPDTMWLAVLTLSGFHRYLGTPLEQRSPWRMAWFGTVLGWSFLARPYVRGPFMLGLLVLSVVELIRAIRRLGGAAALRRWAMTDVVAGAVAALWLVPVAI